MYARILESDFDKAALIKRLSDKRHSLMVFFEDQPGPKLSFEKVSETITLLNPPYEYEALKDWLYLGDWQGIFPASRSFQPFDTFRTEESVIEQRMKEAHVELIIDSFHDDIEWKVIEIT